MVSILFPPVGCVSGEGTSSFSTSDVARLWFGPKYSFLKQEASQCPPSGLTVCLQAVELAAAAPSRLYRYVSKETTHRENDGTYIFFFFVYIYLKQMKPNFKQMLLCFGMFFIISSRCSLTPPCTAVQFIHF